MTVLSARPSQRPSGRPGQAPSALRAPGLDWLLMLATLALVAIGTLLVWSATSTRADLTGGDPNAYLRKQLVNVAIGLVLMVAVMATDHRWVRILAPLAYVASVVGLVLVLVAGSTINGSRSWLQVGGMSIQPSEFAKLAVVIGMALVVAERTERRWGRRVGSLEVAVMLVIAGIPAVLILLQPDLGTMLVLSATVFGVLAIAGAGRRWLGGLTVAAVGGAVAAVSAGCSSPTRSTASWPSPTRDSTPAEPATTSSRRASLSATAGLFGQGFFEGSQTRSGFVPEQHTDFIFTVAGEELGLVGAGVMILLLAVVIWRALAISAEAGDLFGRVAAAGIACWWGFQAFQNIGMCLGIMPVTGVPLPFVSTAAARSSPGRSPWACWRTSTSGRRARSARRRCPAA